MNTKTTTQASPFFSLLAVLFIGLKLTGYITWSWWWVLAPIWGPALVVLLILAIMFLWAMTR